MVNVLERFNKTMKENFMLDREKGKLLSYIILSLLANIAPDEDDGSLYIALPDTTSSVH